MSRPWPWQIDPGLDHIDMDMVKGLDARIHAIIDDNRDRYVEGLRRLIRFPTVSGSIDPKEQRAFRKAMDHCLTYMGEQAEELDMDWRVHKGVAAIAEWRGTDQGSVAMAAHLDVVPATGEWQHDPFGGQVQDGEIWGRGAQDDKGPVAASLAAIHILRRLGLRPEKDIRLLLGTLEETDDWPDMDLLLEREGSPEVTLVPDGAFPVNVGEKGIMTVAWHARWRPDDPPLGRASPDGAGPRFVALRGGERHNVVPGEARVWVTCGDDPEAAAALLREMGADHVERSENPPAAARGEACTVGRFDGTPAHAAYPQDGDNAALKALRGVAEQWGDTGPGPFARFLLDHCSDLDGWGLDLDEKHTHMGDATLNLGVVEIGQYEGHSETNVRFPLGVSVADVFGRFEAAAAEAPEGLRVRATPLGRPQPPLFVSPEDHPHLIHTLQAAYHTVTGREPRLMSLPGTTYAKIFPLAMGFGPQDSSAGEPVLAHQKDERVTVARYLENIRIYALALAMLSCAPEQLADAASIQPQANTSPR